MASSDNQPRRHVWDTFGYLLGHQLRLACTLSKPTIDVDEDDLADMLHHLIGNLARGFSQKEIYRTVAPCLRSSQQHAVFSEVCSWMFATEGVLSTLYQPLLSQHTAGEEYSNMHGLEANVTQCKYWSKDSAFTPLTISSFTSKGTSADYCSEFNAASPAE